MIKTLLLITSLTFSIAVSAADIYGVSDRDLQTILKRHGKEIAEFEAAIEKGVKNISTDETANRTASPLDLDIKKRKRELVDKLIKEYGFLFIDVQIILYPDTNKLYTTIEIVDKDHPERLRFISPKQSHIDPEKKSAHAPDLIEAMIRYDNITLELLRTNQLVSTSTCPVYHCTSGFDSPELKPWLAMFNEGAVKEKTLILNTLKHDPNPERRAAAAFLVGHFQDPHEILSVLLPQVTDKDEDVRNNVMRVMGTTMMKAKISDINIEPILALLDSPSTTDRNKALIILLTAVESDAVKKQILQKGTNNLLAILRLEQPNNHDWAYHILKKISGKDFGETNLDAWRKWYSVTKKTNFIT